jgi:acyl carrier protein
MAVPEFANWMAKLGIQPLAPQQATLALGRLMGSTEPQLTVVDVDWPRFRSLFELRGSRPLLEHLASSVSQNTTATVTPSSTQAEPPKLLQMLQNTPEPQRLAQLMTHLQKELASILGLTGKRPDLHQGFFEMGMDSLMAVELKQRLEAGLGCSLPGTLAFEAPTIQDLAQYLVDQVLGWSVVDDEVANLGDNFRADDLAAVASLSEDELEASIGERLAQLESLIGGR